MKRTTPTHHLEALQSRIGLRLAARLGERGVTADVAERLRVSRLQALEQARSLHRTSPAAAPAWAGRAGGSLVMGAGTPWWVRLASAGPLLLLLAGLLLIQHRHQIAQVNAAAEVDAALLADDLPPDAYRDPGFFEYLKQRQP